MNTTPTHPQEVTAEDVPLLSADPELKTKGIGRMKSNDWIYLDEQYSSM